MRPKMIILIHALIGIAVESGGSIVDSYRTRPAEELDQMIRTLHREMSGLLTQLDPDPAPETEKPRPDQDSGDPDRLPF